MAFFALAFSGCEEIYTPKIDDVQELLVVESRLTNDPKLNFVKLSMTRDFYSTNAIEWVTGAHLELIEVHGETALGTEVSPGNYTFSKPLVAGKSYILWISHNSDVYESEPIVMPPLPKIDTLYTRHKIEQNYRVNGYGVPELFDTPVREFDIDAPVTSQLAYYRFACRAIIQWEYYPPPSPSGKQSAPWYGWRTKTDQGLFNVAGPKEFSVSEEVRQHPILTLGYDGQAYLDSATQLPSNWIVIIDQYGLPEETFHTYEKINKQFSAEGNLFDPSLSQVYGNLHCKNNPAKIILGFAEVCSHRQYRYYMNLGTGSDKEVVQRRLNRYYDIPDHGHTEDGTRPVFWEYNY